MFASGELDAAIFRFPAMRESDLCLAEAIVGYSVTSNTPGTAALKAISRQRFRSMKAEIATNVGNF